MMIRSEDYVGFSENDVVAIKSLIVDLLARLPTEDLEQMRDASTDAAGEPEADPATSAGGIRLAWTTRAVLLQQALDRRTS